jgi:hypothetical protein
MGVNSEHLGRHVRCPHCQEVVLASPPAASEPPPAASEAPPLGLAEMMPLTPAPPGAAEDIFSATDLSEDLFGRSEGPRLELPPDPLPPTLPEGNVVPAPQPQANMPPTLSWAPSESGSAASWMSGTVTETLPPPPASTGVTPVPLVPPPADGEPSSTSLRARQRTEAKAPWFLLLVFCPLLLYAIVISIFAFFLYRHEQQLEEQMRNPFEMMPDVGDDPGVRKVKKVSLTDRYKPELATLPLPESLCTTLGKPIRIGDLQVTPNRVERKLVSVKVEFTKPEHCQNDSLVLYLDMKNLSSEYAFAPLDNYFDRYWRPGVDMIPPLTQLEIGNPVKYRCYGGPAHWHPRSDRFDRREWVQGRSEKGDFLQPGEEKQFFVCTDGDDNQAAALLFGQQSGEPYHGTFLWRVRVRRGLTRFQDKDRSATAVIGVRFSDTDIHEAQ